MKRKNNPKTKLRIVFILGVALVLLLAETVMAVIEFVLTKTELVTSQQLNSQIGTVFIFGGASIILGLVIAVFIGRWLLKPVETLMDGLTKLSEGTYETRIGPKESGTLKGVAENFNHLAKELQNTEILRSDFINSFSHEFKTPISSINGLITLMKTGKLSQKKQREYLDIIAEETLRLSELTTNILNLTKYENQGILTDKTRFNLSEQIRMCVLLLEKKWSAKNLNLSLDFDEFEVLGNEDMLRQVWINILDNAIKFSSDNGNLSVRISKDEYSIFVEVENDGPTISQEDQSRIFQRFYRADSTHEKKGNGIGLSIVASIVKLHYGKVMVKSEDGITVFTVVLPV